MMMTHTCNPSTWKSDAGRTRSEFQDNQGGLQGEKKKTTTTTVGYAYASLVYVMSGIKSKTLCRLNLLPHTQDPCQAARPL